MTARVTVTQDGWQRVPLGTLANLGLPVDHPENLHLFTDGVEQAAEINNGALEFYGRALDSPYSNGRAYFVDAQTGGAPRMATGPPAGSSPDVGLAYPADATIAEKSTYFSGLLNGDATNFFGSVVSAGGRNVTLAVPRLVPGAASLNVVLQAVNVASHAVDVTLNGTPLGRVRFSGLAAGSETFPVTGLVEGANTVGLKPAAGGDVSLVASITANYQHAFTAESDTLSPPVAGGQTVRINGFERPDIRVVDVTDPAHPIKLPATGGRDVSGAFAQVTMPGTGSRRLFAFTGARVITPAKVERADPSFWNTPGQRADLVVITTAALASALAPLVDLRRREGLIVVVIPVDDLFDGFSYGHRTPSALRDFLAYARANWAKAPRYVILGGSGSHDPRGYLGAGTSKDIIPVKLVDTEFIEAPSDPWISSSVAVGRLPAKTPQQMSTMVAKIVARAAAPARAAALLANGPSSAEDFPGQSQALKPLLPEDWTTTQITSGAVNDRQRLLEGLNDGPALVNYSGHGSVNLWSGLLNNDDAPALTNSRPSLYVIMSCLNGYFSDPNLDALGERLLASPGGAYAVWASSAQTDAGPQVVVNQAFMRAQFPGRRVSAIRLGDATREALADITDSNIRASWTLLGDPTSRLG